MPITPPTPVDTPPEVPDRSDRGAFPQLMYAAFVYLFGAFKTGVNNLATNAYNNATEAYNAATTANTKAGEASDSAFAASAAASAANTKAGEALASANAAAQSILSYQGALAADPVLNKSGGALAGGDWYINTVSEFIRAYTGSVWVNGISALAGVATFNGQIGNVVGVSSINSQTGDVVFSIPTPINTALYQSQGGI